MDNSFIFLSGFLAGLFVYWVLWRPKKKKVGNQEYAIWEHGAFFVTCSYCGCKISDESNYCPNCGYRMLGTKKVYQEPESIGMSSRQFKQVEEKLGRAD